MGIELVYTHSNSGVTYVCPEILTLYDVTQAVNEVYATDKNIKKLKFILIDLTQTTGSELASQHIRQIAQRDMAAAMVNPNISFALASPNDLIFGFARMWQGIAVDLPWEVLVSKSLPDAKEWIALRTKLSFD